MSKRCSVYRSLYAGVVSRCSGGIATPVCPGNSHRLRHFAESRRRLRDRLCAGFPRSRHSCHASRSARIMLFCKGNGCGSRRAGRGEGVSAAIGRMARWRSAWVSARQLRRCPGRRSRHRSSVRILERLAIEIVGPGVRPATARSSSTASVLKKTRPTLGSGPRVSGPRGSATAVLAGSAAVSNDAVSSALDVSAAIPMPSTHPAGIAPPAVRPARSPARPDERTAQRGGPEVPGAAALEW